MKNTYNKMLIIIKILTKLKRYIEEKVLYDRF